MRIIKNIIKNNKIGAIKMNEIDLRKKADRFKEYCELKKYNMFKNISYNLYKFFKWSDKPTLENRFVEIYNRVINGEDFDKIIK